MRKLSNQTYGLMYLILALAGLLSVAALMLEPAGRVSAQVVGPSWSSTGNLNTARYLHTATLLPNGKVLVAGGYNWPRSSPPSVLNSAELYDPATGIWSSTGNLNTARSLHTATLLPNGKVLVAGGITNTAFSRTDRAELYDPATGTWSITGNLNAARSHHTATLLPNGKVLVAGGYGISGTLASAELYDPATGTWGITGSLNTTRGSGHPATLLPNGKVLVAGGDNRIGNASNILNSAELYDPATGTWSYTGNLNTARFLHTATLLSNGKVLIAGGENGTVLNSAELYDPATGTWSYTGNLNRHSFGHTATLLPNGQVLVVGGSEDDDFSIPARPELYDPATGTWSSTANLNTPRGTHTATLLPNGKVLVAGGGDINLTVLNSAELFDLSLTPSGTVASVSAASFSSMGLASEAIATSFGTGLAATTIGATTLPLPTQLSRYASRLMARSSSSQSRSSMPRKTALSRARSTSALKPIKSIWCCSGRGSASAIHSRRPSPQSEARMRKSASPGRKAPSRDWIKLTCVCHGVWLGAGSRHTVDRRGADGERGADQHQMSRRLNKPYSPRATAPAKGGDCVKPSRRFGSRSSGMDRKGRSALRGSNRRLANLMSASACVGGGE